MAASPCGDVRQPVILVQAVIHHFPQQVEVAAAQGFHHEGDTSQIEDRVGPWDRGRKYRPCRPGRPIDSRLNDDRRPFRDRISLRNDPMLTLNGHHQPTEKSRRQVVRVAFQAGTQVE